MEDKVNPDQPAAHKSTDQRGNTEGEDPAQGTPNSDNRRKRKAEFSDASMRYGGRGGHDGRRDNNSRNKKGDMGRGAYLCGRPSPLAVFTVTD